MKLRQCALAAAVALLAACASDKTPIAQCPPAPQCPPCPGAQPEKPPAPPLQAARWEDLPGWAGDDHGAALAAFRESCRAVAKQPAWKDACERLPAPGAGAAEARAYFEREFAPYRVVNPDGSDQGLITGYYEPLLKGARTRSKAYAHALHGVPDDLLVVDLGELYPELKGYRLRGRLDGRSVKPYYSSGELRTREAQLAPKALYWVADPIELFFLQVQGSGRIELPDGARVRVGYADQNGHPYRSIGRWLVDKGELTLDQASMQGIQNWARKNPQRLPELLAANPSYVFFRELPPAEGGPPGALGVPLTAERSIAVDPRSVPLGAPVFLDTTEPGGGALQRLMAAQDTGGAIRGAVRADFFWGFGPQAGAKAGTMKNKGRMWVLLPPGLAPK